MTRRQAVKWADRELEGIPEGELNARWLIADVLGVSRLDILSNPGEQLPNSRLKAFERGVRRLKTGEPLAYITGKCGFWGRDFLVRSGVLIPRQDTETLVEAALSASLPERAHILDLCCGSGALAITLRLELEFSRVTASDISPICLRTASRNAALHHAPIDLVLSDMLDGLKGETFDLIVCNPPYIPSGDMPLIEPAVRDYEPVLALDGGEDGLSYYRELCAGAQSNLSDKGIILMEVGHTQAGEVSAMFENAGYVCAVHRDLNGIKRVVEARCSND